MSIEQDAKRYRAIRAYGDAVRAWYRAHPVNEPVDFDDPKPFFACGVVIVLGGDDLDQVCDEWIYEHEREDE